MDHYPRICTSRLRHKLDRSGYILRRRGAGYLITDLNGLPVHETEVTPFSQTLDDVRWWADRLCE